MLMHIPMIRDLKMKVNADVQYKIDKVTHYKNVRTTRVLTLKHQTSFLYSYPSVSRWELALVNATVHTRLETRSSSRTTDNAKYIVVE
jgi:hypothetical protein